MTSSLTVKQGLRLTILAMALALAPAAAHASTIVDWGSTWEYTFCDPSADANWKIASGPTHPTPGCSWSSGPAVFGNTDGVSFGDANFAYATYWQAATAP